MIGRKVAKEQKPYYHSYYYYCVTAVAPMAIKPDGCIVLVVAVAETRVCCLVRRAARVPPPRLASDGPS
jgi:hypothetical protein